MTRKEQDAIAKRLRMEWQLTKGFADRKNAEAVQRGISRVTQAIADALAHGYAEDGKKITTRFDRQRFVDKAGFGHIDQF